MRLKTKLFNVRIPIDLLEKLTRNRNEKGITKSFQVTEALKNYLK